MRNLNMSENEWDTLEILDIAMNDNSDIAFIHFNSKDDVSKFTSKAVNLPQDKGKYSPRIIMYVDKRAQKRHKAFQNIAKSIRDHSGNETQTNLRTGKYDFLLRTKKGGTNVPWSEIPLSQLII